MLGCNDTEAPINARSPVSARCPFDTTRIYVSPIWFTSQPKNYTRPLPSFPLWPFKLGRSLLAVFDAVYLPQDTALALWIPCTLLSGFEAGLSAWCFLVGLGLRGLVPCARKYIKEQVCVCLCGPHWSQTKAWTCTRPFAWYCVSVSDEAKEGSTDSHLPCSSSLKKRWRSLHTTSAWSHPTSTPMLDAQRGHQVPSDGGWKGHVPPALRMFHFYWV